MKPVTKSQRKSLAGGLGLLCLLGILAVIVALISKSNNNQKVSRGNVFVLADGRSITITENELQDFSRWLLTKVYSENTYAPDSVQEAYHWAEREVGADRLKFGLSGGAEMTNSLFSPDLVRGIGYIDLNFTLSVQNAWDNFKSNTSLKRQFQNDVVVQFTESVAELQIWEKIGLEKSIVFAERVKVGKIAWALTVVNVVRPLVERLEPMPPDLIQANDVLVRCGSDPDCPAFADFVILHTKSVDRQ